MKPNAIVLASIVAALLVAGCGNHGDVQATGEGATLQPVAFEPADEAARAGSDSAGAFIGLPHDPRGAVSADSLPPDISVSASDTPVIPGNPVEIIAHGTPDVTEVVVWDGIGQRQLMTYDSEGKVWRVFYRVPLRTSRDRLGLSVTAKNAANKWRRVWVSLIIQREASEAKPEPASGS